MLIVDMFKKYCKSEFTKDGYTLSFIDTSALCELNEEQAQGLKRDNIKLVVNNFVLHELVKGLNKKEKDYGTFFKKKLQIMEYLDIP
jgi:predicted nucleic acid-binding protein